MRAVLEQRIEAQLARQKAPREKAPEKAAAAQAAPAAEQKPVAVASGSAKEEGMDQRKGRSRRHTRSRSERQRRRRSPARTSSPRRRSTQSPEPRGRRAKQGSTADEKLLAKELRRKKEAAEQEPEARRCGMGNRLVFSEGSSGPPPTKAAQGSSMLSTKAEVVVRLMSAEWRAYQESTTRQDYHHLSQPRTGTSVFRRAVLDLMLEAEAQGVDDSGLAEACLMAQQRLQPQTQQPESPDAAATVDAPAAAAIVDAPAAAATVNGEVVLQ